MRKLEFLICGLLISGLYAQRPYQPWVQRLAVKASTRQLVVALHSDLWIMYDLPYATLRMAWQGGPEGGELVKGDYINNDPVSGDSWIKNAHNVHQFNPSGTQYYHNEQIDQFWSSYSDRQEAEDYYSRWSDYPTDYRAWVVKNGSTAINSRVVYKGYLIEVDGIEKLQLNFALKLDNGHEIMISELPEHTSGSAFSRGFVFSGIPAGHTVELDLGGDANDWSGASVSNGRLTQSGDGTTQVTGSF